MVGAGGGGSLNLGQSKIKSDYTSVAEQSAIRAGDGGFQVNVQGKTTLTGGQITSTQAAVQEGKNQYSAKEGTQTQDLQNTASYEAKSVSIGLGAGKPSPSSSLGAGLSGVGIGSDGGSASSTSTAAISGIAGNTQARTGDKETGIAPIFDAAEVQREIQTQVAITSEFGKQAGKAITDYTNGQRQEIQARAESASTPEEKAKLAQAIKDVNMQERALNILVSAFTGMTGSVVTKEALSTVAEKFRDLMIEDSKKFAGVVDSTGKLLSNLSGPSSGLRGDNIKLGGTRVDLDLLCGPSNERCTFFKNPDDSIDTSKPVVFTGGANIDGAPKNQSLADFLKTPEGQKMSGLTGGVQGVKGTLFGIEYEAGSWQDKLIESFAGTHDLIGGKAVGLYDKQGNIKRGMTDLERAIYDKGITVGAIPIAAPFSAAEGLNPEVWKAIGILLGVGK